MSKDDIRKALIVELTAANGDEKWSTDMVNRIERGALKLPRIHAERAHELVAALVKRPSA